MAATLRGWVMAILPSLQKPAEKRGKVVGIKVILALLDLKKTVTQRQLTCLMEILWELCSLPAASLTGNKEESALSDSLNQLGFVLIDRQVFGHTEF